MFLDGDDYEYNLCNNNIYNKYSTTIPKKYEDKECLLAIFRYFVYIIEDVPMEEAFLFLSYSMKT